MKNYKNYKLLNANIFQQILKNVDTMFKSFFSLLKLVKQGKYNFRHIYTPNYLPKNEYANLIISHIRIKNNIFTLPYSNAYKEKYNKKVKKIQIKIPTVLEDKK